MNNAVIAMNNIFENSAVYLHDKVISKELLTKTFSDFLAVTSSKEGHSIGLVLHTGSVVFDVIAVTFAAVSNLLSDDFDSDDVIGSLKEGDYVLYADPKTGKQERYKFCGCEIKEGLLGLKGKFVKLEKNGSSKWVKYQKNVMPYNGTSTRTDGRGLRKKNLMREVFLSEVLGVEESKMTSVTETSTILLYSREKADEIIKGISFCVHDTVVPLLDIVTVSYFTENAEYPYRGNTGKNDPVIKITGKAAVARKLIRNRDGNKTLGLIVLGDDVIRRNHSELTELVNKKSMNYVFLMTHIDSELGCSLTEDYEDADLFACTKEFLLSNSMPVRDVNSYTNELSEQIDIIIDKAIEPVLIESFFTWDEYQLFQRAMSAIKRSEYAECNSFIIQAYSLMKLFQTIVFSISGLGNLIKKGEINIVPLSARIRELHMLCEEFTEYLKSHAKSVISILEKGYSKLVDMSSKGDALRDIILRHCDKRIAVVVPKSYYSVALRKLKEYGNGVIQMFNNNRIYISTANQFDNTRVFDLVIIVGNFSGKRFDMLRCRAAKLIIPLFFDFELKIFRHQEKKANLIERNLDKRAYITKDAVTEDDDFYDDEKVIEEIADVASLDEEIDEYISKIKDIVALNTVGLNVSSSDGTTEIVAIGSFETGEKAFFTKLYKAYVFDEMTGEVRETEVDKLTEGDSIVFTKNNDDTRDIVDEILRKLIESNRLSDDVGKLFNMSKYWKEILADYMKRMELTPKEVAKQLRLTANGDSVTETTIRIWIDADAHTVGPQKIDSLSQIASLVGDDDMLENVNDYFSACKTIRGIRRDILNEIGKTIVSKLNGNKPKEGTLMASIYDRIDSVTQILRLETISLVAYNVPVNATNRPLKFKEN